MSELGARPVAQLLSLHIPLWQPRVHQFKSWVRTYTLLIRPCCGRHPTYKSRGRWTRMLAQGQSSSAKRGGLAVDISSGVIFLKKKKKNEWIKNGRHFLNVPKNICLKIKANFTVNGEIPQVFSLQTRDETSFTIISNWCIRTSQCGVMGNTNKSYKYWKGRDKLSLFVNDMII